MDDNTSELAQNRAAMARLAPELRRMVKELTEKADALESSVTDYGDSPIAPSTEAIRGLTSKTVAMQRDLAARMARMAGISELGSVAQTDAQMEVLQARMATAPSPIIPPELPT